MLRPSAHRAGFQHIWSSKMNNAVSQIEENHILPLGQRSPHSCEKVYSLPPAKESPKDNNSNVLDLSQQLRPFNHGNNRDSHRDTGVLSCSNDCESKASVFLAGSIEMGTTFQWQRYMVSYFSDLSLAEVSSSRQGPWSPKSKDPEEYDKLHERWIGSVNDRMKSETANHWLRYQLLSLKIPTKLDAPIPHLHVDRQYMSGLLHRYSTTARSSRTNAYTCTSSNKEASDTHYQNGFGDKRGAGGLEMTLRHPDYVLYPRLQQGLKNKKAAVYTVIMLASGPSAAMLLSGLGVPGGFRTITGVISTSAAVANIPLHTIPHSNALGWGVAILCVVSYATFLAFLWKSLEGIRRPAYLFSALLSAATFAGSALFADKIEDTINSILTFGPLVATSSAALLYVPFRYEFGFRVGPNDDVELQTRTANDESSDEHSHRSHGSAGQSGLTHIFQWW